jgi:protein-disulfide isomerase
MSKRTTDRKQAARVARDRLAREKRRRRTLVTSAAAVVLLLVAGLVGWAVYANQRADSYLAPPGAVDNDSGVVVGSGPITVDIYVDFLCPYCKQFEQQAEPTIGKLVSDGKVTVVYHPVAFLDRMSTTEYSTRASAASGCVAEGGKFQPYAKALFEQQPPEGGPGLPDDKLISIGTGLGLTDPFPTCVRDGKYKPWTQHVTEVASERGVNGTPTVLVAGKQIEPTADALSAAVAAAS